MTVAKRFLLLGVSVICALLFFLAPALSQNIERVASKILNGQLLNASVTVYGVVDKWDHNKANNTIAYVLRDDWGDSITVISESAHPETNKRYRVSGYVSYDPANRQYMVMETGRAALEQPPGPQPTPIGKGGPPPPPIDWVVLVLGGAVILVLAALIFVLLKSRQRGGTADFDSGAIVTVADKTQKISAAVADQKAIDAGTVKVMPGRFEVVKGTELKEIRLIRPRGVPEHRLQYTFGRLTGDRITHIQLNDATVSSSQAHLRFRDGKYTLINIPDPDDPDRNATVINNQKMKAHEAKTLAEGDSIQLGHVTLVFHEK